MTASFRKIHELVEYRPKELTREQLTDLEGQILRDRYANRITVDPPSVFRNTWTVRSDGWVGFAPVSPETGFAIAPKVPIGNLFRMLEVAYQIKVEVQEGLIDAASLEDFYDRLARILASRVLDRSQRGLYRSYLGRRADLTFVRGAIDLRRLSVRPWAVRLPCSFEEHTADLDDNRILVWTLLRIAQSGLCTENTLGLVRRAYHTLQRVVAVEPCAPRACVGRLYHRLNQDYEPMHALCRFFLENTAPVHHEGDRRMVPLLLEMAPLFERFVAEWLKRNLPPDLSLRYQVELQPSDDDTIRFKLDMILQDDATGRPLTVLDAKYKFPVKPDNADIFQVTAYANTLGCPDAVLVYPARLVQMPVVHAGDVTVRTLAFDLDGDLDVAGRRLWLALLNRTQGLHS